jgi:predicted TIM-barrel fold metal-dependent hydrolase
MDLADSHVHLFVSGFVGRYGRPCSGGDDLDVYQSFRREHRIDTALVVAYEGEASYRGNNEYVARLAGEHAWIVAVAFTPTHAPILPAEPFAGIAVYRSTEADADRFASWPRNMLDRLGDAGMIISVNAVPEILARAGDALRRLEGCQVLISHLGQPGAHDSPPSPAHASAVLAPLLSLSDAHHIGVKLSGLYDVSNPAYGFPHAAARPFVDRVADAFGSERLYWGSDFSPALDHVSFAQTIHAVSDLPWSGAERAAVMGGNLRRLVAGRAAARPV